MARNHDSLSEIANLGGPQLLDKLTEDVSALSPAESGTFRGAINSMDANRLGNDAIGMGHYQRGLDKLDVSATLLSGIPRAVARKGNVDIPKLHVYADLPERLRNGTGQLSLMQIGRFTVAVGLAIAEQARARVAVTAGANSGTELIYDDFADGGSAAMNALDRLIDSQDSNTSLKTQSSLRSVLNDVDDVMPGQSVALVVSDFMSGYDPDRSSFDWESGMSDLNSMLDDRLMVVRLDSEAQRTLPIGAITGLSMRQTIAAQDRYKEIATQKDADITGALRGFRQVKVQAEGPIHPIHQVVDVLYNS